MAIHIEVDLIGLELSLEQRRGLLDERRGQRVRTGLDRDADVEILVDCVMIGQIPRRRLEREELDALAVERELELVRIVEPFYVRVAIASEAYLDFVLGIQRKVVMHQRPASRPERQLVEVGLLRQVRRQHEGVAAGRLYRAANCQMADLLRRREIPVEQRR